MIKERPYLEASELHAFGALSPRDLRCAIRYSGDVYAGMCPPAGLVSTVLVRVAGGVQTPVAFEAAARSVDVMMRRSTGSLLLAGTRDVGVIRVPALWEMTTEGIELLGVAPLGSTPTSIGETRGGDLFVLTETDLHFLDVFDADFDQRLFIMPLPQDERGGHSLSEHRGRMIYSSRMSTHAGTDEGGPNIDALVYAGGDSNNEGPSTAWFGHNNLAVWMNDAWGIDRFETTSENSLGKTVKTAWQSITYFDGGAWLQPAKLIFNENFVKWRRLQELNDVLLAFGKRAEGGHIAGVGNGRSFRIAEFGYEVLRAVKCPNATGTGEVAMIIARHAQDDPAAPPRRIVETTGQLVYPTPPPEPESSTGGGTSGTSGSSGGGTTSTEPIPTSNGSTCGPMDICFVVDTTGSMGTAIASVRRELELILDDVVASSGDDYRLSLIEFKDYSRVLIPLANTTLASLAAFKVAVRALEASGGGNEPEASDEAVNHAIEAVQGEPFPADAGAATNQCYSTFAPWREGALKIVILITDARPAGFDDNYEEGVDDARVQAIAEGAAQKGIKIATIYTPTARDAALDATVTRIMRLYARVTGSVFARTRFGGGGTGAAISRVITGCGVVAVPEPVPPAPPAAPPPPRADDPDNGAYQPGVEPSVCILRETATAGPISAIQAFDAGELHLLEIFTHEYSCVWCRIDSTAPDDDLSSFTERVPYSKWHGLSVAARSHVDVLFYLPVGATSDDVAPVVYKWN